MQEKLDPIKIKDEFLQAYQTAPGAMIPVTNDTMNEVFLLLEQKLNKGFESVQDDEAAKAVLANMQFADPGPINMRVLSEPKEAEEEEEDTEMSDEASKMERLYMKHQSKSLVASQSKFKRSKA